MANRPPVVFGADGLQQQLQAGDTALGATVAVDYLLNGFTLLTETTLAFNDGTYVFTLGSVGATWNYYRQGIKYTITGAKTATLAGSPPTAGKYYIYLDSTDGTLTASGNAWTLAEADTKVPVATIQWNNASTPKYLLGDERHPLINRNEHRNEHSTEGTKLLTRTTISTLVAASDAAVDKRPTLSAGEIADESLFITQAALTPGGNPYTATDYAIAYRTNATTWAWMKSAMPFKYNGAGSVIQWDNAGTMQDGTGGTGSSRRWYNMYLLQTDITNDGFQYTWIPGRGAFTTLTLAQAEDPASFDMTGFLLAEYVVAYQITFAMDATYTSAGKCVYAAQKTLNLNLNAIATQTSGALLLGTLNTWAKAQRSPDVVLTSSAGHVAVDATYSCFALTLTENTILDYPTNTPADGYTQDIIIKIINGAAATAYSWAFGSGWNFVDGFYTITATAQARNTVRGTFITSAIINAYME